ncbi:hypothetical protein [Lysobacter sp. cf310]|uniref:hypothetical protein n=1 Tax=Lysobacter sp. cf310 TaxID=1761790 RepID=UPI0008ED42B4|nr:hypothetical protein [Lysobacter sp. cf310]SFK39603.1 hypothetical protein SAMN04487938_0638 [Lysobacter sp. cf310]
MPWYVRVCALVLLSLAALLWPRESPAQIRRCVGPDGAAVFTDRRCEDIGSSDSLPRNPPGAAAAKGGYRGGCARSVQDLVYQMTSAIDAHDGNRLAGVYHWTGMSGSTGYSVLDRLETIARRPLVDIVPIMPTAAAPPVVAPPAQNLGWVEVDPTADVEPGSELAPAAPEPEYVPQARRLPVALRVEQTLANGSTPSHTVFGLIRHFGCWWIKG